MSMFTDRLRNDRNPFDNYDLREQAADKIEKLEAALREAVWLIGELERHEGAEGWSEYLRKRLDAFDASAALAPEQDK